MFLLTRQTRSILKPVLTSRENSGRLHSSLKTLASGLKQHLVEATPDHSESTSDSNPQKASDSPWMLAASRAEAFFHSIEKRENMQVHSNLLSRASFQ